jgi:hypothetical protein
VKSSLWLIALLTLPLSSLPSQATVTIQSQSSVSESTLNTLDFPSNQLLAKKIPRIPKVPNRATAILSNFKPRTYKFGSKKYNLGRNDVRHILERHHPKYWRGKLKPKQTFLNEKMGVDDVVNGIESVVKQKRSDISKLGINGGQVEGIYNGVTYILGVDGRGRIRQFFPK